MVLHKHIYKRDNMFKGIRCESLLSLREVVIEWGIIGVCTDMPSKTSEREREYRGRKLSL